MRAWSFAIDGPFRCISARSERLGRRRMVRRGPDGVEHCYQDPTTGEIHGAVLCAGAGADELGAQVAELRAPAFVASQAAAEAARTQDQQRLDQAAAVLRDAWRRVRAPAPPAGAANLTNAEARALFFLLRHLLRLNTDEP